MKNLHNQIAEIIKASKDGIQPRYIRKKLKASISIDEFSKALKHLEDNNVIKQIHSTRLICGMKANYSFYVTI